MDREEIGIGNVQRSRIRMILDWGEMVGLTELESVTSCVSSRRSNQLSYGPGEPSIYHAAVEIQNLTRQ